MELGCLRIVVDKNRLRMLKEAGFYRDRNFNLIKYIPCQFLEFSFQRHPASNGKSSACNVTLSYDRRINRWQGNLRPTGQESMVIGAYSDADCSAGRE